MDGVEAVSSQNSVGIFQSLDGMEAVPPWMPWNVIVWRVGFHPDPFGGYYRMGWNKILDGRKIYYVNRRRENYTIIGRRGKDAVEGVPPAGR